MSVEQIIYILSCQHRVKYQAFYVSGKLYCGLCHEYNPIREVEIMEWRANCRHCRFARWAGMSEETAEIFANGHVSRNPRHIVSVEREAHLAATKTKAKLDVWRILPQS
jgi:hypothetical protein